MPASPIPPELRRTAPLWLAGVVLPLLVWWLLDLLQALLLLVAATAAGVAVWRWRAAGRAGAGAGPAVRRAAAPRRRVRRGA